MSAKALPDFSVTTIAIAGAAPPAANSRPAYQTRRPRLLSLLALCACLNALLLFGTCRADEGSLPGVAIAHKPASTGRFIGSPSIVVLSNGSYLVTHDVARAYGNTSAAAILDKGAQVYVSHDRGATWQWRARVPSIRQAGLFIHRDTAYLMGLDSATFAKVLISRSADEGKTWTVPDSRENGVLMDGFRFHTAPAPVIEGNGRVWRAMEDRDVPGLGTRNIRAFMLSAPADADLLKASSWTSAHPLASQASWMDGHFGGWLEGNAVQGPHGEMLNILRIDYVWGNGRLEQYWGRIWDILRRDRPAAGNKAAMIHVLADGTKSEFNAAKDIIDFPGGSKKFTIRYDSKTQLYWSLSNVIMTADRGAYIPAKVRNTLALVSSPDLKSWRTRRVLLHHADIEKHGFHYADWQFDGADIVSVMRVAYDDSEGGARTQHDSNYLMFYRVPAFRGE